MFSRLPFIALSFLILFLFGENITPNKTVPEPEETDFHLQFIYSRLSDNNLNFEAFRLAYKGFIKIHSEELLFNDSIITVIDYSKPSSVERLYILDIKNIKILEKSLVAHGQSTGSVLPESFSNVCQSHKSSLGFYITENTYLGKHGYSLRIEGIEKGINDNAKKRAIVFHGAQYVSWKYISEYGRIGRSFGCPALPLEKNREIIDLIKDRSCVFIYHPSSNYLKESRFIIPD